MQRHPLTQAVRAAAACLGITWAQAAALIKTGGL